MFNLTRELGGSIGTAWMTTQLDNHAKIYASYIGGHVDVFNPQAAVELSAVQRYLRDVVWDAPLGALAFLKGLIARQALSIAFNENFVSLAMVFLASLILVPLLRRPVSDAPVR